MNTTPVTDYFAPIGRNTRFEELTSNPESLRVALFPTPGLTPLTGDKLLNFDTADRFTYIIMGLAVLIAVVIPLLNLN